jgi:hypothetical protein
MGADGLTPIDRPRGNNQAARIGDQTKRDDRVSAHRSCGGREEAVIEMRPTELLILG